MELSVPHVLENVKGNRSSNVIVKVGTIRGRPNRIELV